jgi:hypothetical protein
MRINEDKNFKKEGKKLWYFENQNIELKILLK